MMVRSWRPPLGVRARTWLAACCVLAASATPVHADPADLGLSDYTVTTWNENDGLSAARVTAIQQDQDGYLWLGTDAGVVRFDGVRFEPFVATGETQLQSAISTLLTTRDRSLWVGGSFEGVARVKGGVVTRYGTKEGVNPFVTTMVEDRTGRLWIGTRGGLLWFDGAKWHPVQDETGLGTRTVLAAYEDSRGALWVATPEAVYRRGQPGAAFEQVDSIPLSSNRWQSFAEDDDGRVWRADFRHGLQLVERPQKRDNPGGRGWGVQLLHDHRQNLWLATRGQGLWRVRLGHSLKPEILTTRDGLATNAVQSVFEDREGNVWVGTYAGLQRLTPHKVTPIIDLPVPRGIDATTDGNVWVGTTDGLNGISASGRRRFGEAEGLPGAVVLSLHAHRNDVWVSTERAIAKFSDGRFQVVRELGRSERVFSLAVSDGSLWARDVNFHLSRLDAKSFKPQKVDLPQEFLVGSVSMTADRAGRLWVADVNGNVAVREPGGALRTFETRLGLIQVVYQDAAGDIWLSGSGGLGHLTADGRLEMLTPAQGLPRGVSALVEDKAGALWLGFRSGIARLDREEIARAVRSPDYRIRYRFLNSADGAAGIPMNDATPGVVRARDGRLWFATSGGVTIVDPEDIGPLRPPIPVRIESLVADSRRLEPGAPLTLPARTSLLQVGFTALTLSDSVRVAFRYRLEGVDASWNDAGTSRQTSYTHLPPGDYRFRVQGTSGDGVWSDPGAMIEFTVQPMFYQTGRFWALCLVIALSVLYLVWQLNARRVRRQFAMVLAERIRMSRALHDTLLQGLAGLALQLDDLSHGLGTAVPGDSPLKQRVLRMRRSVEEYIREARRSIRDLRSPAIDGRQLPEVLQEVGARAINGAPIALDLTVSGTPQPCNPVVQEQLALICQEAVTNAVRHGQPNRVEVGLSYTPTGVRLSVSDDGRGFDPATPGVPGHYGVVTMQERAAQVGGKLTIASTPGQGTQVSAMVPAA